MSDTDPRIAIIQTKLAEARMHPSERDALADDLRFAQEINGDTAPVMQTLKTMLIAGVRRELLAHERTERHFASCPVAGQITKDPEGRVIFPWEKRSAGAFISFSIKDGFKATGASAWIASIVVTIMTVLWGLSWWQTSKAREEIKSLLQDRGFTHKEIAK